KFISQVLEAVIYFLKSQFKPSFYGSQWCIRFRCDFALAHASEKSEVDCLLLSGWQAAYDLANQHARVAQHYLILGGIVHPCVGLLFGFILQAFLRACVSLLLAQPIDCASSRECDYPAERFAFLRGEVFRLVPDLHKNLLQEIVGLSLIMNHSQD